MGLTMPKRLLSLILLLSLASPLIADSDPATVIREFLAAEASGDAAQASARWIAPETFLSAARIRRMRNRCARLVDLSLDPPVAAGEELSVDTREVMLIEGMLPAARERIEVSHSRFTLRKVSGAWRIARQESREAALVERLTAAKDSAERERILAAAPELRTETLVILLAGQVAPLTNQRRLDEADELARTAEAIAETIGDPRALAEAASARSVVARRISPTGVDLGVELSMTAVSLAEASGDPDSVARAFLRLARANEDRRAVIDMESLESALSVAGALAEDPGVAALAAMHLSRALEALDRRREAFRYAVLAAEYAESSEEVAAKISAYHMLGSAYLWAGSSALGIRFFRQSAELAAASGNDDMAAFSTASLANAQESDGQIEESFRTIDEALKRFHGTEAAELYRNRMQKSIDRRRYDEAERDLRQAISLDPSETSNLKRNEKDLAEIRFRQGRYAESLAHAESARAEDDVIDQQARTLQARALYCLGRRDEALRELEELAAEKAATPTAITDPQRSVFVPTGNSQADDLLIGMSVERGNALRALEISELAKSQWLRDVIANSGVEGVAISNVADQQHEHALDLRVRELNRALVTGLHTPAEAESLRHQLAEARIDLTDFRSRALAAEPVMHARYPPELRLDALPARLDDVTILSFAETGDLLFAFIVGPKRNGDRAVTAHIIPVARGELKERVDRFAAAVGQRSLRARTLGAELYGLLIAPLGAAVRQAKSLCIIPDHDLWRVPFHALGPRDGPPLVAAVPLFYAPSIPILAAAEARHEHRPRTAHPSLLAFANPTVGTETASLYRAFDPDAPLGAIPETETEVRTIAAIYGKEHSRVRIGPEALETMMKREAPSYDILHIATHGVAQPNLPMFSSVVLSVSGKDEEEDGLLEAREIIRLNLHADMTVLSACDTGKSNTGFGTGVIGLSWAFLAAGCPTTVVSQWKAQSAATSTLMIEFHRQLAAGLSKPAALRAAQLKLRRDPRYSHPFYWAPFVVIGAP
jgi:CHAT domain-containing protein